MSRVDAALMDRVPALLAQSELLFLCVPATDATRELVDDAARSLLPRGAILVNPARGALVDEGALLRALESCVNAAAIAPRRRG